MKEVLVLNAVESCKHCPCIADDHMSCRAYNRAFSQSTLLQIANGHKCRPAWCGIKPLPETRIDWSDGASYDSGWNDVLKKIGGNE